MNIIVVTILILVWIGVSCLVGLAGKKRRIGFWGSFFITLFTGLMFGLIFTFISDKLNQTTKIIRCDGCQEIINGEYIAIRPKELDVKLDYCNADCRHTHHANNLEKLLTQLK